MGDKHRKYNNVYIKNFGEELDDETLKEKFSCYGKIISAKVINFIWHMNLVLGFCCALILIIVYFYNFV